MHKICNDKLQVDLDDFVAAFPLLIVKIKSTVKYISHMCHKSYESICIVNDFKLCVNGYLL